MQPGVAYSAEIEGKTNCAFVLHAWDRFTSTESAPGVLRRAAILRKHGGSFLGVDLRERRYKSETHLTQRAIPHSAGNSIDATRPKQGTHGLPRRQGLAKARGSTRAPCHHFACGRVENTTSTHALLKPLFYSSSLTLASCARLGEL